ncbi:HAMP domain-containing protein [Mucilaginibacter humi]|uniref:HAMP domain-containing protein n=1 Tax=Mucilaginibacter humi TaxID=2732510 RepID=UPI001C2EECF0|nr:HAMP domain-containing protein [Mucilaginibacter humi]
MASNLTGQIRGIAKVATGIAKGNLKQRLSINAPGEVAQLTDTINEMIDTLAVFADEVTTVAREVGVQGRLGGQQVCRARQVPEGFNGERKPAGAKLNRAGAFHIRSCIGCNQG